MFVHVADSEKLICPFLVVTLGDFHLFKCHVIFCRIALTIMIFVNYGGGGYYFFKHARWNGEFLSKLFLIDWYI